MKTILTNCRGVAVSDPEEPGFRIHKIHLALSSGDDPETTEVAAPASVRTFVAGDTVTVNAHSDDGDFALCEDRAGAEWWIPSAKLA